MKSLKISILVLPEYGSCLFYGNRQVQAQEFTIQGDLVSSYVWRGFYQTGAVFSPLWVLGSVIFL